MSGHDHSTAPSESDPRVLAMTKRELEELPDADLLTRCMAPIVRRLHGEPGARTSLIRQLSAEEGALLAFWILYSHAERGLTGFCVGYPHRMVHEGFWTLLEVGLRRIGDDDLQPLVVRLRAEVARTLVDAKYVASPGDGPEEDRDRLGRLVEALRGLDPQTMRRLDDEYARMLPGSLRRVGRFIREHAAELVSVEA